MGYRDDFYDAYNIIGYTGSLHEKPTVYFKYGKEFGHIMQSHTAQYNVGREEVQEEFGGLKYVIENVTKNGEEVAIERLVNPATGKTEFEFHSSRSKFIDTSHANVAVFAILAQSIEKFTAKKTKTRRQG